MPLSTRTTTSQPTSVQQTLTTSDTGANRLKKFLDQANSGWQLVGDTAPKRMVASITGPEKSGKDHTALSALECGGPAYIISLDRGTEGVAEKFSSKYPGRVHMKDYPSPGLIMREVGRNVDDLANTANEIWIKMRADFIDAIHQTADEGITIIDTGTEAWELLRLARFGVLNPKTGKDHGSVWGPVNAEFTDFVRMSFDGWNVAWLHKVKDEWKDGADGRGRRTGKKEYVGFGNMPYLVQVNMVTQRAGAEFQVHITDSRHNPDLNDMDVDNHWPTILEMLHA